MGQGDILSQHLVGQCGPQGRAWAGLYSDRQSKTVVSDSSLEIREVVSHLRPSADPYYTSTLISMRGGPLTPALAMASFRSGSAAKA